MRLIVVVLVVVLTSCYKTLSLEDFDKSKWEAFQAECTEYRVQVADLLIENQELLLNSTQNEVESLLGSPDEHELYKRNQKFFHYRISQPDSCGFNTSPSYFSIRFNAIGRASEVQLVVREN